MATGGETGIPGEQASAVIPPPTVIPRYRISRSAVTTAGLAEELPRTLARQPVKCGDPGFPV
jgi:hypothetical protein